MHTDNYLPVGPGYTNIPNIYFDYWVKHLSGSEWKVLSILSRKVFGWHKAYNRDRVSLSQLEEFTGLDRKSVLKAVEALIGHGLISKIVCGTEGQKATIYELIFASSNISDQWKNSTGGSGKIPPTKETIQNKGLDLESTTKTEKILYKNRQKQMLSILRSDIHRHFLEKYSPEVINQTIDRFQQVKGGIGDAFKLLAIIAAQIESAQKEPFVRQKPMTLEEKLRESQRTDTPEYQKKLEEHRKKPKGKITA